MRFKEFANWCNDRACDGYWGMDTAIFCMNVMRQVNEYPFWDREKEWRKLNIEHKIEDNVVTPINYKIAETYGNCGRVLKDY